MQRTLKELADLVGGRVAGDGSVVVTGINSIDEAGPGEITFLANPRYASRLTDTKASAVIVTDAKLSPKLPAIVVPDPDLAFAQVAGAFADHSVPRRRGVHPTAVVGERVTVGRDVGIGPQCVVEEGATIGDGTVLEAQVYVGRNASIGRDCLLYPHVSVRDGCILGDRVILHCGVVVGADGFGYVTVKGVHHKIPQIGIAVLEDDVEVGANAAVDRARFGRTIVRRGTKIDNLVQVGHNVHIGEQCLLAAQVGIAGSTRVGHHVMLGGQVGVSGHIELGDRSIATAQSGVDKNLPPGTIASGAPARPRQQHLRGLATVDRLPETLRKLKRRIEELEKRRGPGQE
ncbi:MAG: UDP-3-O-(3-hydroxymyristoyl)glucosamine N-acyltransferase [Planctomycetes bacterium]|nr:UDP-3-O-(3-hydroxymyristoyl)glucosamine N-acyltransferase [Planctomycetota bacterium]